jgi:hypothetical protein
VHTAGKLEKQIQLDLPQVLALLSRIPPNMVFPAPMLSYAKRIKGL